jgi:uncharacterized protein YxeA
MNKKVVVGVAVVVIVAAIAAILLLNHPNSNSSNTVVTPTTSTTTTTTPITTTTTTITTSTSVNTSSNLSMNSIYFINENSSGYYYLFVLNLTSYKEFLQQSGSENPTINNILIQSNDIIPVQIIEKGDYLFVIGRVISNISLSIGNNYTVVFALSSGTTYNTQMIYQGTWAGSIP